MTPKSEPAALVVERTVRAPSDLVWRALTNKDDIKQWSFDIKEFKAEAGFEFEMTAEKDGVKYIHLCRITEAIPRQKLAYTWRYQGYEGDSLVTFELFDEGEQTRVKLTHEGLESFPRIPDFARENFVKGWTWIVGEGLRKFVEEKSVEERSIIISRDFDAPRELVWRAMTEPQHWVQWWGPRGFTTTVEVMEVREGGAWKHVMHGPDGTDYPNYSVFKEVVKPERISFTHGGAKKGGPEANFLGTWTFEELPPGRTRVTVRMVFASADERNKVVEVYGAIEGGKQTLERLAEHLPRML